MKWVQLGAALAAASVASYAWGAGSEPRLGGPVELPGGVSAKAGPKLAGRPGAAPAVPFGRALARLQADSRSATRGVTDVRVYQRAAPAVVLIVTDKALGSGALISPDGKIITNLHVVADAKEVGVIFKPTIEGQAIGKADVRRARVLQRDDVADLALIQVAEVPKGVTPLVLGESAALAVGADVHAIGHPTGESWTYTKGVVSQVRRAYDWKTEDKIPHEATVIQTQTPINPGNSGGPLLDDDARIVGINSFSGEGEGLNYAVSAEDVKTFLARGRDRLTAAAARKAAAAKCEWKTLKEVPSKNPKGTRYLVDTDCDGVGDTVFIEPASKKDPEVMFIDTDGDGKLDTMLFDNDHDGNPDEAMYDTDGDGEPDMRGFFRNGEHEPYRWEKMDPVKKAK